MPGAMRYRVYYKGSNGWVRLKDTVLENYIDFDIKYGETRTYTVRCRTNDNKDFASDYDHNGTTVSYFSTPKLNSAYLDGYSLYVDISDFSPATKYYVWIKNGSSFVGIGSISSKSGWIYNAGSKLKAGNYYTFIVQGYDENGNSITYYDQNGFGFRV